MIMAFCKRGNKRKREDHPATQERIQRRKTREPLQPSPKVLALEVIAALYWDIHCVTLFDQIVSQDPSSVSRQDLTWHHTLHYEGQALIVNFVHDHLTPDTQYRNTITYNRCLSFVRDLGWQFFAICAFSEAFRRAILIDKTIRYSDEHFNAFKSIIADNRRSIKVFALTRSLDWRIPLLGLAMYDMQCLPSLRHALAPEPNLATEHPHHIVQTHSGRLQRPRYKGKVQVNAFAHLYHSPADSKTSHLLQRKKTWGPCEVCSKPFEQQCNCRLHSMAGDLTELVEYPNKGVGVRALSNFRAGDILGEYVGVIRPIASSYADPTYLMTVGMYPEDSSECENLAIADGTRVGNWTRYVNHSCGPSTRFAPFVAGPQATACLIAGRDIAMFEEVTIHYGDEYWSDPAMCRCGAEGCMSRM